MPATLNAKNKDEMWPLSPLQLHSRIEWEKVAVRVSANGGTPQSSADDGADKATERDERLGQTVGEADDWWRGHCKGDQHQAELRETFSAARLTSIL